MYAVRIFFSRCFPLLRIYTFTFFKDFLTSGDTFQRGPLRLTVFLGTEEFEAQVRGSVIFDIVGPRNRFSLEVTYPTIKECL